MRVPVVVAVLSLLAPAVLAHADTLSVFTINGASQFYSGTDKNMISGTATIDTTTGLVESISFLAGGVEQSGLDSQGGTSLYVGSDDLHFTISGNTLVGFTGDNFNLVGPNDLYVGQVSYASSSITGSAVTPEPATLFLLGTGLLGSFVLIRRRSAVGR